MIHSLLGRSAPGSGRGCCAWLLLPVAVLTPLASACYLRVFAVAPLATISTALFAIVVAVGSGIASREVEARARARRSSSEVVRLDRLDNLPVPADGVPSAAAAHDRAGDRGVDSGALGCVACIYLLISAVLLAMVWSFNSRVGAELHSDLAQAALGAVSPTTVRVWARSPSSAAFCVELVSKYSAEVLHRSWAEVSAAADHTGVATLTGLQVR